MRREDRNEERGELKMAEYVVFIYDDEAAWVAADPQTHDATMEAHRRFVTDNAASLRGGHRLHPSGTATSIRSDARGNVTVTDGAFAEAKEVIGGYYVIEAADLDEALAIARQVPASFGGVEVRPVWPPE
jgi:hypothetical protein